MQIRFQPFYLSFKQKNVKEMSIQISTLAYVLIQILHNYVHI